MLDKLLNIFDGKVGDPYDNKVKRFMQNCTREEELESEEIFEVTVKEKIRGAALRKRYI